MSNLDSDEDSDYDERKTEHRFLRQINFTDEMLQRELEKAFRGSLCV